MEWSVLLRESQTTLMRSWGEGEVGRGKEPSRLQTQLCSSLPATDPLASVHSPSSNERSII